jgi:hypothetical protein
VKPRVSMRAALGDPALLGTALAKPSWSSWKVLLIAAAGEKLTPAERKEFERLTGRAKEPGKMVKEFAAITGRRSGKTFAMACFLVWIAALCDHTDAQAPGEKLCALAISRDQRVAKIILGYVEGIITASPLMKNQLVNVTAETIELKGNVFVEVRPCSKIAGRGMTSLAIIADELGHWFTATDFANPDVEVLAGLRPSLLTTRGPLLMASSVYAKQGVLYDVWRRDYGPEGASDILVAYGTSRDLHADLPQDYIDSEIERDPVRNKAEYLSIWRDDVAGFLNRDVVEAAVRDYVELPPEPGGITYTIFVDPATGVDGGDSYAMAVAHRAGDMIVIDALREIVPPFSPSTVIDEVRDPARQGLQLLSGGRRQFCWRLRAGTIFKSRHGLRIGGEA